MDNSPPKHEHQTEGFDSRIECTRIRGYTRECVHQLWPQAGALIKMWFPSCPSHSLSSSIWTTLLKYPQSICWQVRFTFTQLAPRHNACGGCCCIFRNSRRFLLDTCDAILLRALLQRRASFAGTCRCFKLLNDLHYQANNHSLLCNRQGKKSTISTHDLPK